MDELLDIVKSLAEKIDNLMTGNEHEEEVKRGNFVTE